MAALRKEAIIRSIAADFDPDLQASQQRLEGVATALRQGREINFPDRQSHIRFAWEGAVGADAQPLKGLMQSLQNRFGRAAFDVAGGGAQPFGLKGAHLAVQVNRPGLLNECLGDREFRNICTQHGVSSVFTAREDLKVGGQGVVVSKIHPPRPL